MSNSRAAQPLGLDIGSSYMRAARLDEAGQAVLVADEWGATEQPALVRYTIAGPQVGHYAARYLVTDYECTARDIVRYLCLSETPAELRRTAPFAIEEWQGQACFNLLYASATAGELYGMLAGYLVRLAEAQGSGIGPVVLTCPASASDSYRVALCDAALAAGIEVAMIINQPTAALLALMREAPAIGRVAAQGGYVAVVDVGSGSSDVTIARISSAGITVLASAGEPHMGGADFGFALAQAVNTRFANQGVDIMGEAQAGSRSRLQAVALVNACTEAMEQLSEREQVDLLLDHGAGFGNDLWAVISRRELEGALSPHLLRLAALCDEALQGSGIRLNQIQAVALVGGASQIPAVQATIAAAFGKMAGELVCRSESGAVARGAAIQAGILSGAVKMSVRDVAPHPLGINCLYFHGTPQEAHRFSPIIDKNAPIPTPAVGERGSYTRTYHTVYPNQTEMSLVVLQYRGRKRVSSRNYQHNVTPEECERLGEWILRGIQPRRESKVDVTFSVDASGILHLHAQEQGSDNVLTASIERW